MLLGQKHGDYPPFEPWRLGCLVWAALSFSSTASYLVHIITVVEQESCYRNHAPAREIRVFTLVRDSAPDGVMGEV